MKKVLSIVLAIAMIASMSVVAFAATINAPSDTAATIPVKGVYDGTAGKTSVYKIDITWDEFTYTFSSGKKWNPGTYQWEVTAGDAGWDISEKSIDFLNHSDKSIAVSATYEGEGDFNFTENVVVAGADAGEYATGSAQTGSIKATFVPNGYTIDANNDAMGTITVKVV